MRGAYLVRAGRLVHAAGVLVLLLGLGLVGDAVGLVHGGDVVAERDGLDCFVHAAAHGPPHLGGRRGALLSRRVLGLLRERRTARQRRTARRARTGGASGEGGAGGLAASRPPALARATLRARTSGVQSLGLSQKQTK